MTEPETYSIEGTPEELAAWAGQLPAKRRYRLLIAHETPPVHELPVADPANEASIALLRSWIAQAPTDPAEIRIAEEELREFKRNMNIPRKEVGARLLYPDVE